jgi:hypothetical protein
MLTNSVSPSGISSKVPKNLIVPLGVLDKAQLGLRLLKDAVLELGQANGEGVTNSDVVKALGLQSDYAGGSKDYLSWSLLGLLMREGKMKRVEKKRHKAAVRQAPETSQMGREAVARTRMCPLPTPFPWLSGSWLGSTPAAPRNLNGLRCES